MTNKLANLAYELCSISSITGCEIAVMEFLCNWLTSHGLLCEKIPVNNGRFNLLAFSKPSVRYSVMFCTHVDTVAPFFSPFLDEKAGILHGRGSCDAKGIAAAMIMAVLRLKDRRHDDVALLLTVGEEESSDGAKACMPLLKDRARFLVVGEPTELRAAYAQKGSVVFDLIAEGKEAHSSQPKRGDSAIHKLVLTMSSLINHSWPVHKDFGDTYINFGEISGGSMRNVIAGKACARGIMRTSVDSATIKEILNRHLSSSLTVSITSTSDPFTYFVPPGVESFLAGFGSDAPYLREIGKPILLGPGSLDVAHSMEEQISVDELFAGSMVYEKIALQL